MGWSLTSLVEDAIAPVYNGNGAYQNNTNFYVPPSEQTIINPGQVKKIFSGWNLSGLDGNTALGLLDT